MIVSCKEFKTIISKFYDFHKRQFVWRDTDNPYYIFISEVMLQQTQASRVEQKFSQLVKALPDFNALADVPFAFVLALWKGLGYNRRAK